MTTSRRLRQAPLSSAAAWIPSPGPWRRSGHGPGTSAAPPGRPGGCAAARAAGSGARDGGSGAADRGREGTPSGRCGDPLGPGVRSNRPEGSGGDSSNFKHAPGRTEGAGDTGAGTPGLTVGARGRVPPGRTQEGVWNFVGQLSWLAPCPAAPAGSLRWRGGDSEVRAAAPEGSGGQTRIV